MTPLFIWFGAVGVADLTAALSGRRATEQLGSMPALAAAAAAVAMILISGYDNVVPLAIVVAVSTLLACGAWRIAVSRILGQLENRDAKAGEPTWGKQATVQTLCLFCLATVLVLVSTPAWPDRAASGVQRWIDSLPYGPERLTPGAALSLAAGAVFLMESSNVIVRMLLRSVSITTVVSGGNATVIRGGRLIGPIERILILGLAAAGEPTAAALVISAKGLLRYPEISNKARGSDSGGSAGGSASLAELSEYLVLGSMLSWTLALAVFALLPP